MISQLIIKTLIAVVSAVAGAAVTFTIKLDHHKLCKMISFSAGALFSSALFALLPEASRHLSILDLVIFTAIGILFFAGISKFVAHLCPACSATHFDEKSTHRFSETAVVMMSVLSIHSFLDGVAISVGELVSAFHHTIFAAVLTHKFPEGLALASLMLSSGFPKKKIVYYVLLIESTTILGGLIGNYLFHNFFTAQLFGIVQANIAGGFIFLSMHAIAGEVFLNHKKIVTSSFLSGVFLILLMNFLFH